MSRGLCAHRAAQQLHRHQQQSLAHIRGRCQPAGSSRRLDAQHVRQCAAAYGAEVQAAEASEPLLERFWLSRGVQDPVHRQRLVETGMQGAECAGEADAREAAEQLQAGAQLGVNAYWQITDARDDDVVLQVVALSRRVVKLHSVLGGGADLDVVRMLEREPRLLTADLPSITRRLLEMKVAAAGSGVDVLAAVQAQPALLLVAPGRAAADTAELLASWVHGLAGDGDDAFAEQLAALARYREQYGDAHCGQRDGDDPDLVRWAAKQRADARVGKLSAARRGALESLGFEFTAEAAEWGRWYNELTAFQAREGHACPTPLAGGVDFQLMNWCSIQRIAARSHVLSQERVELLDAIGFDWSGADALS